jgi:sulfur transfer complex TusBCD TusB component (DsrH family)
MKTVHLIRKSWDPLAEEAVIHEARRGAVAVVLIQDGVWNRTEFPGEVFVSREDLEARRLSSRHRTVDYRTIATLIVECDRAVVW